MWACEVAALKARLAHSSAHRHLRIWLWQVCWVSHHSSICAPASMFYYCCLLFCPPQAALVCPFKSSLYCTFSGVSGGTGIRCMCSNTLTQNPSIFCKCISLERGTVYSLTFTNLFCLRSPYSCCSLWPEFFFLPSKPNSKVMSYAFFSCLTPRIIYSLFFSSSMAFVHPSSLL